MTKTHTEEVDDRTIGEAVADRVTEFGGSWKAVILGVVILVSWIGLNVTTILVFDGSLILLNLFLSMIAAFQAPFIMMSQNRSEKKQDDAYRSLFKEIKMLVIKDIALEKKILKVLAEQSKRDAAPPV